MKARNFFLTISLTALTMSPAFAAVLKTGINVTGDTVTVGDVFDGAGGDAGRYLAPAPAPGASLVLDAADLSRISNAFHLGWLPASAKERAVITHASNDVDRYAIEAALQDGMAAQLNGQKFDMDLTDGNATLSLPAGAEKTVQVDNLKLDLQKNRFTAVISAPAGAQTPLAKKEVTGSIHTLTQMPVLKNPMRAGDVIGAQDVDYVDMRTSDVSANAIADADKLIGQTPRRNVPAMRPVNVSEIEAPTVVKKGDLVTVVLKAGILNLTVQGRALQGGSEGDVVRVVNTASNRIMDGVVSGLQTVTVNAPSAL